MSGPVERPVALFVWGETHADVREGWRAGNGSAWVVHGRVVDTVTVVGGTPATADRGVLAGRPVAHSGKFYGYVFELYDLRPVDELPYDVVAMADRVPVAVAS